jgi:hypothetical protein
MAGGTFSIFPSTAGSMGFDPAVSKILFPVSDKIKLPNEVAPSRFLTVLGIVNEK